VAVDTTTKTGHHYWVRRFNKQVINRIMLLFAGRRVYAVVHHVGRKSGKPYKTPVVAALIEGGLVMPLPYGTDTDWCLNVVAAGRCTIELGKETYEASEPEIIGEEAALAAFPGWLQRMFRRNKVGQYLRVKCVTEGQQSRG
jgi:deazaflavin-dependent oxidoreductase (nitroreductase family)